MMTLMEGADDEGWRDDDDVYYYIRWRLKLEGDQSSLIFVKKKINLILATRWYGFRMLVVAAAPLPHTCVHF